MHCLVGKLAGRLECRIGIARTHQAVDFRFNISRCSLFISHHSLLAAAIIVENGLLWTATAVGHCKERADEQLGILLMGLTGDKDIGQVDDSVHRDAGQRQDLPECASFDAGYIADVEVVGNEGTFSLLKVQDAAEASVHTQGIVETSTCIHRLVHHLEAVAELPGVAA